MLVKTFSASVQGLQAAAVTVEVNATQGIRFVLVGLPDSAVKESYERILAAIENSGYTFPARAITINMAPADVRKEGSGFDLPMAIGILATNGQVDTRVLNRYMMVGELSLDGSKAHSPSPSRPANWDSKVSSSPKQTCARLRS